MTTNKYDTRVVRVNGRDFYLRRIYGVEQVEAYSFRVTHASGRKYLVWGGHIAGGRSNEWFVDGDGESYKATSLVDGLKLLDGM
jgi:hypothetical protein